MTRSAKPASIFTSMSAPQEDIESPPPAHVSQHPVFSGKPFGMLTADKPRFPVKTEGGNKALESRLKSMGLKHERTSGSYGEPEESYIVHGPTREQMQGLGHEFGQESVIFGEGGNHELHYTHGPQVGHYVGSDPKKPISYFSSRPGDFWTALPGDTGFTRINFDPEWKLIPTAKTVVNSLGNNPNLHQQATGVKKNMSTKHSHSMADLKKAVHERLLKFETEFAELGRRELRKALPVTSMDPGIPELPDASPNSPVGSASGVPSGQLMAPAVAQPTPQDPNAGGGATNGKCITCGNEDVPGACTCLGQLMGKNALLGYGANAGQPQAPGALAMSEKSLCKVAPPGREAQVKALKPKVGEESAYKIAWASKNKAKSESSAVKAADKMKKEEDFVSVDGKKKTIGVAAGAKLPPSGPDNDNQSGEKMDGQKSKVVPQPGSGGEPKANALKAEAKPNVPNKHKAKIAAQDAKMPAAMRGVMSPKAPVVMEASPDAERKAEPSMAKPPSGKNPGTMTPVAPAKAPKVSGAPGGPMTKAAPAPAMPTASPGLVPKKPAAAASPAAAPAAPANKPMPFGTGALKGSGTPAGRVGDPRPQQAKSLFGHIMGKSEGVLKKSDLGLCLICGDAEHAGICQR